MDADDISHSLLSAGLEVVRLPERSMAGLVADLLQPGVGDAGTQRDEVLSRLAALLRRLLVARDALMLRWEPARRSYRVWRSTGGVLHDTSAIIPAEAEPLPLVTAQSFGLSIAHPAESRHLDSSLRPVLGQGPALLLPLAGPQMLLGVLVLDLARRPHAGEVALALTLAQRAMAAIAGAPGTGKTRYAGQRPPRDPRAHARLTPSSTELTSREREVVRLLASGLRNKEIGAALGISERTVKFHLGRIFDKLEVDSRTELLLRILG